MTQRDPVSTFWGPQKAYMDPLQWPWPFNIHLQLYGLQPGALWDPGDAPEIFLPHILTPIGSPGHFIWFNYPWFFQYRHRHDMFRIRCTWSRVIHQTFEFHIHHGVQQFAYNEITEPAGVFAFDGSASIAWEAL